MDDPEARMKLAFGERLRRLRQRRGLRLKDLEAAMTGGTVEPASTSTIGGWERGEFSPRDVNQLLWLDAYFDQHGALVSILRPELLGPPPARREGLERDVVIDAANGATVLASSAEAAELLLPEIIASVGMDRALDVVLDMVNLLRLRQGDHALAAASGDITDGDEVVEAAKSPTRRPKPKPE